MHKVCHRRKGLLCLKFGPSRGFDPNLRDMDTPILRKKVIVDDLAQGDITDRGGVEVLIVR
ncbi:MAG: hypothetical protein EA369_08355, partial [Bradymonadales bacterium]